MSLDDAVSLCRDKIDALRERGGLENLYGPQRFGLDGINLDRGYGAIAAALGEEPADEDEWYEAHSVTTLQVRASVARSRCSHVPSSVKPQRFDAIAQRVVPSIAIMGMPATYQGRSRISR